MCEINCFILEWRRSAMSGNKRWRDQRHINENSNICLLTFWLLLRKPSLKSVAIEQQSKIEGDLLTAKSSTKSNSQSATRSQKCFVVSVICSNFFRSKEGVPLYFWHGKKQNIFQTIVFKVTSTILQNWIGHFLIFSRP